ncbi:arsenate reductase, glutathione/glutaredoxin type [Crocosphaera sp.]|uniref:arsenate reductase, glutathione/glutaredoxin type n=1 Tax=Crocosphaera sp. TaxID=2729996 RepID=UPI0026058093|nr:arsenate reductase, glutathione/glutaredoxin type [Crocosphaera sp.]MDJ0582095.1 arsenate reductase, glutathione/glutaredoxin type [Crocosphaera sp.]
MKKLMFVCKRNSCRSQMAEGFAKTLGKDKIEVTSSGLEASRVHPVAIQVMDEIGINITDQTSDALLDFDPDNYDAVISLCGCGVNLPQEWVLRDIFEDWELDDPDGKPIETFYRVRDEIKAKVAELIKKMEQ